MITKKELEELVQNHELIEQRLDEKVKSIVFFDGLIIATDKDGYILFQKTSVGIQFLYLENEQEIFDFCSPDAKQVNLLLERDKKAYEAYKIVCKWIERKRTEPLKG